MPNLIDSVKKDLSNRLHAMQAAQTTLLEENKAAEQENPDLSGKDIKIKYDELLSQEKYSFAQLDAALSSFSAKEGEFPIKTNKLQTIVSAISCDHLSPEGELPSIYNNLAISYDLPTLGNREGFWGTSKSTFYTSTLLYRLSAITGKRIAELSPLDSPIYHVAPLTQTLIDTLGTTLVSNNSYILQINGHIGFGFPHSGYAFGGSRKQELFYPEILNRLDVTTKYYPEDCSSWLADVFKQKYSSSTADLLCAYRRLSGSTFYKQEELADTEMLKELVNKYIPVHPTKESIQPGDMYIVRRFDALRNEEKTLGISGHVGLVSSHPDKQNFQSLEFNRDMPQMEGFGSRDVATHNLLSMESSNQEKENGVQKKLYYLRLKP